MSQIVAWEAELEHALSAGHHLRAAQLARALGRRGQAAELYEKVGEYFEAAVAYRESGLARKALNAAVHVHWSDPCYSAAARLAIEVTAALRVLNQEVDDFLAHYLSHPPESLADIDAMFLLAQLYEVHAYNRHALEIYRALATVDPTHPAAQRLKLAEASALNQATTELSISLDDVRKVREIVRPEPAAAATPRAHVASFAPGSLLAGRYRIERPLASGSSGIVFEVFDLVLQESVALKLLDPVAGDETQQARFLREVSLSRRLAHPNIVRMHDLGEHGEKRFLTMELLDGSDLRTLLDMGRLDDAQKKQLLLQALDGLGYAHSQRIVHRDIKPENLFVTRAGQLKIADFGIAKGVADPSITQSGSMGGTPYYISPEQITDFRNVDYRTDMYALGVLAYELFTGRVPFDHPSLTQLLLAHLEAPPTPMRAFRPELPEALDALVLRLLQKVPRDRFESCAETRDALARIEL